MSELKPGLYRHFKGGLYRVLGEAKHSETDDVLVIYREEHGDKRFWVRPVSNFLEWVSAEDGTPIRRFIFQEPDLTEKLSALPYRVVMVSDIFGKEVYERDTWEDAVATMARLVCQVNGEGDGIERVIGVEMNRALYDGSDEDDECDHNEMVENPDPEYAWKCALCGHVYGRDENG